MNVGDPCRNCKIGRLYHDGGLPGGFSHLACHACGWRPEAVQGAPLPAREAFWQAAEARGITREQFDLEWEQYQASRMPARP